MTNELTTTGNTTETAGQIRAFIDTSTKAGQMALFTAIDSAEPLAEHLDETMNVKSIVSQRVQVTNEDTGEIRQATRTVFVLDDNRAVSTMSDSIAASVNTLMSIFGTPDTWDAPIGIVISEKRSRKGRRFYSLTPVM